MGTAIEASGTMSRLLALVTACLATLVAAVGVNSDPIVAQNGLGSRWTCWACDGSGPTLHDVSVVASDNAWAVGDEGTILHWNGQTWTAVECPIDTNLKSIDMVSADDGWAVSSGWLADDHLPQSSILRWDGRSWTEFARPKLGHLNSVRMASSNDGWAVGGFAAQGWLGYRLTMWSEILHWDGQTWTSFERPTDLMLNSVDARTSDCGWAVGGLSDRRFRQDRSTILHWDGHAWTEATSLWDRRLHSVDLVSADDGWAVGSHGATMHWDGGYWTEVPSPTREDLWAVAVLSSMDGWAVGSRGTILHWDGTAWSEAESPTGLALYSVAMVSADDGWAVGSCGTILRWSTGSEPDVRSPTPSGSPSSTPPAPGAPTPRPTWTAVPTRTPKPYAPETPSHPQCVCEVVHNQVPSVVIEDALANPEHFYGWRYRLDQGKPVSPANPLRECLSLLNVSMPYHPTWNKPVWRVGCP